jgi:pilus assembly protein CpaC
MIPYSAPGAPRPKSLARAAALILVFVVMVLAPGARAQVVSTTVATGAGTPAASGATDIEPAEIDLLVGRSAVVNTGTSIARVSLSSPAIADAMVTSQQQLLVHGKAPGSITMFVWNRAGGIQRFEVNVQRDLSVLQYQMKTLFPGEPIKVYGNGKDVVISGIVSSKYVVDKAADVAAGYVEKKEDVVNLLKQEEGVASQQVLLRVRFAEVSRNAMTELGATVFANGVDKGRWFGRTATDQTPAPFWDDGKLVFSDFLNLFLFDAKNNIGGAIKALQNKGLFQSLAEPNLIAENGKEASFLAGGEYPYPVVQGQSGGQTVTIQFKEFGVKLNFTPTIVGDSLVKLKVRPEVSSLDFSNAITLQGFRVPAITTRRTETEVELQDGQTFAIAGLMNNTVTSQMQKIPGIGDIPILGLLFRSKAAQKEQSELVVMITPQILKKNSTGVSPQLPNIVEPFMEAPKKTQPSPAPWNPGEKPQAAAQPAPAPAQPRVSEPAIVEAQPAPPAVEPEPGKPTKAEKASAERVRKEEQARAEAAARQAEADRKQAAKAAKKQAEEDAKQAKLQAEQDAKAAKLQAQQAEKERQAAARAAKEQARLDAELQKRQQEAAKLQAEQAKKQAEQARKQDDKKRGQELARAEQKLKQAQAEYEAALGGKPQDEKK